MKEKRQVSRKDMNQSRAHRIQDVSYLGCKTAYWCKAFPEKISDLTSQVVLLCLGQLVPLGSNENADTSTFKELLYSVKDKFMHPHRGRVSGIAKQVSDFLDQNCHINVDLTDKGCYTNLEYPGVKLLHKICEIDTLSFVASMTFQKEKKVHNTCHLRTKIYALGYCPKQCLECMHLNLTYEKMLSICTKEVLSFISDSSPGCVLMNKLPKPSRVIWTQGCFVKHIIKCLCRCSKHREGLTENDFLLKKLMLEVMDLQMQDPVQILCIMCHGSFLVNSNKKVTVITDTCTACVVQRYSSFVLGFENDLVSYTYDGIQIQCSLLEILLLQRLMGRPHDIKFLMRLLFPRVLLRELFLHYCFMCVLFSVCCIFNAAKNNLLVSFVPTLFIVSQKESKDVSLEEFSVSEKNDNKEVVDLKVYRSGIEKAAIGQNDSKKECNDNQLQEISLSEKIDKKDQNRQSLCKFHTIDLRANHSSIGKADIDQNISKATDAVKNTLRQNTSYCVDHTQVLTVFPLQNQGQNNVSSHLSLDNGDSSPSVVGGASIPTGHDCFAEVVPKTVKRHGTASSDNGNDVIDCIVDKNFEPLEDLQTSATDAINGILGEGACGGLPTTDNHLVNNYQISPREKTCDENYSVEESVREDSYHSCKDEQDKGGEDLQLEADATFSPNQHHVGEQLEAFPTPAVDDSDIQRFEPMMDIINKLAGGERVPPQVTMRYEMLRFCTLRSFPKENKPFITRIAQAGFYYANNRDEVVCYCCAKRKSNWTENDNPMAVHQQLNPSCKFLLNNAEVNVSVQKQHELANRQSIPAPGTASSSTNSLIAATANAQTRNSGLLRRNGLQGTSHLFSALPNTSRSTAAPNTSTSITVSSTLASSTFTMLPSMASTLQQSFYRPPIGTDSVSNIAHGNFASGAIASPIPSSIAGLTATALTRPTTTLASSIVNSSTVATLVSNKANIQTCTVTTQSTVSTFSTVTRPSTVAAPSTVTSPSTVATPGTVTRPSTVTTPSTVSTSAANRSAAAPAADPPTPAKYPAYLDQSVRHASFRDCTELRVPAENLAEAGFFYAGFGDCCRCFQCGVGLRHWSAEDDPWIEHSRWSRNCSFVKEKKGEEFVILVQMAVDYQQNQQRQQQQEAETTGGNQESVENLLHSDAAQSVLEMGYSPDVIRRAIHEVLESTGLSDITASTLMEVIFNFEESAVHARSQNSPPVASGGQSSEPRELISQLSSENRSTESSPGEAVGNMASVIGVTSSTSVKSGSAKRANIIKQKKLKEENDRMKLQSICTLCKDKDVCIVFLPCGHLVTCEQCAEKVRYCPVRTCAKYIKGTVRTYVA